MAKRKKPTRSKRDPAKSGSRFSRAQKPVPAIPRKTLGEGFARRVQPTGVKANIDLSESWRQWVRDRGGRPLDNRREQVRKLLSIKDVSPVAIEKITDGMNPDRFYIIRIYGYRGSSETDGVPGDEPILQATFVGSGTGMWMKAIHYASFAPIEDVEIDEIEHPGPDRPLWGKESVKSVDGERFYAGVGDWQEWRDRKKAGRPKKSGGGMTADQRRKNRKSKRAAKKRLDAVRARIKALADAGDIASANKLKTRSESRRKIDL